MAYSVCLWSMVQWTNRNCVTYQAKQPNQHLWKDCVAKAFEFHFLIASSKPARARARLNAKCTKPSPSWHKLNTDAFVTNDHACAGGLIHDLNGNWVQGFSKSIGTTSVLMAKLWALREGIRMAKHLNIHSLIVNVDSFDVVNLISSLASTNRLTQPLVAECKDTLQAFH